MSDSDKVEMKKLVPDLKIDIVPNGIDMDYFADKPKIESKNPRVLYVGNFKWLQNVEAVHILVKEVWPKIKKEVPNAKLWIVGMNITEGVRSFASEDIEITEAIPDIRDAYSKASVLVAPIKGPGGTRLKILEAMASGLPIVTTTVGAEGLGVENGREAMITDNLDELATYAVKILRDKPLAKNLGLFGKKFVQSNYVWEKSANILDKIYAEVVNAK
jgi:glycosyltransferase involved in cell wall biosynthesis